jgi:hypothetical protein
MLSGVKPLPKFPTLYYISATMLYTFCKVIKVVIRDVLNKHQLRCVYDGLV